MGFHSSPLEKQSRRHFRWRNSSLQKEFQGRRCSGTRCSLPAFIRSTGIVHTFSSKSNSSQRAPMTSPVLVAVRIAKRSACAQCRFGLAAPIGMQEVLRRAGPRGVQLSWPVLVLQVPPKDDRASAPDCPQYDVRSLSPTLGLVRCARARGWRSRFS